MKFDKILLRNWYSNSEFILFKLIKKGWTCIMLYNGKEYGKTGFGLAIMENS